MTLAGHLSTYCTFTCTTRANMEEAFIRAAELGTRVSAALLTGHKCWLKKNDCYSSLCGFLKHRHEAAVQKQPGTTETAGCRCVCWKWHPQYFLKMTLQSTYQFLVCNWDLNHNILIGLSKLMLTLINASSWLIWLKILTQITHLQRRMTVITSGNALRVVCSNVAFFFR